MSKILKGGNKFIWVTKCSACDCVFAFANEEIQTKWKDDLPMPLYYEYLPCPECREWVKLPSDRKEWLTRKEYEDGKN